MAKGNNRLDPAVISFSNLYLFLIRPFLPQQDTRGENEFRVSRLANAIHLDPEETDLTKVMKMIQKEGMTAKCLAFKVTLDYALFLINGQLSLTISQYPMRRYFKDNAFFTAVKTMN